MIVQSFFAWRIYLLSRLRLLAGGIVAACISVACPALLTVLTGVLSLSAPVTAGYLRHTYRGASKVIFSVL